MLHSPKPTNHSNYQTIRWEDKITTSIFQGTRKSTMAQALAWKAETPKLPIWIEETGLDNSAFGSEAIHAVHTRFSEDRLYRYTLTRSFKQRSLGLEVKPRRYCMFMGLNPSKADERLNDPTIRRCMDFAQRWGYDELIMANLFAWRDTKPAAMKKVAEPIGDENNLWLVRCARAASKDGIIIAAWGKHGPHLGRDREVIDLLTRYCNFKLHYFGANGDGTPKHPLMLPKTLEPIPWNR